MGFIFEEGEPVKVGPDGQHDFEKAEGQGLQDSGESTLVFVEDTGLGGGTLIDDWERGNVDPYTEEDPENLGGFGVTTATVYEGTYAFEIFMNSDADQSGGQVHAVATESSGLNSVPKPGDTWTQRFIYPDGQGYTADFEVIFGADGTNSGPHYWSQISFEATADGGAQDDTTLRMGERGSNTASNTAGDTFDPDTYSGQWLEWEITWNEDNTASSLLRDDNGNQFASQSISYNQDLTGDTYALSMNYLTADDVANDVNGTLYGYFDIAQKTV